VADSRDDFIEFARVCILYFELIRIPKDPGQSRLGEAWQESDCYSGFWGWQE
jgi:hypothetical protein